MGTNRINITSPVGRVVLGSLYEPNTKDAQGKPLVVKTGPNMGQPRVNYFFAVAVPKGAEPHWAHTPWGNPIWTTGNQAFPQVAQSPAFAWKIEDGDSQIPNKKGRKPCDNEGWPGHWIIKLSGGFAPKVYQQEGTGYVQNLQKDFCKPGYFVEVAFNVEGNGSQSQPGVYLNHSMVCFRAYGQEISFGPDVASAGFGVAALPQGASLAPLASALPMPAMGGQGGLTGPSMTGLPQVLLPLAPVGSVQMPQVPVQAVAAPIPVTPNPGFVQLPPPVAAPVAPVAPVRRMTALAQGTYEAYIAAGWTDALLVQNNLMVL